MRVRRIANVTPIDIAADLLRVESKLVTQFYDHAGIDSTIDPKELFELVLGQVQDMCDRAREAQPDTLICLARTFSETLMSQARLDGLRGLSSPRQLELASTATRTLSLSPPSPPSPPPPPQPSPHPHRHPRRHPRPGARRRCTSTASTTRSGAALNGPTSCRPSGTSPRAGRRVATTRARAWSLRGSLRSPPSMARRGRRAAPSSHSYARRTVTTGVWWPSRRVPRRGSLRGSRSLCPRPRPLPRPHRRP